MITLDVADLVVIAGQTLGTGADAALSQLDLTAARAALAEADSQDAVIADQYTAAQAWIRLMHALLRHRPFPVHGEQVAVAAVILVAGTEEIDWTRRWYVDNVPLAHARYISYLREGTAGGND
jgi:hypothetical protein